MNYTCHRYERLKKGHKFYPQRASFCAVFRKGLVRPQLKRKPCFLLLPIYLSLHFLNVFVFFLLILLTYDLPGGFGQVTVEETSGLPLLSDIRDILT